MTRAINTCRAYRNTILVNGYIVILRNISKAACRADTTLQQWCLIIRERIVAKVTFVWRNIIMIAVNRYAIRKRSCLINNNILFIDSTEVTCIITYGSFNCVCTFSKFLAISRCIPINNILFSCRVIFCLYPTISIRCTTLLGDAHPNCISVSTQICFNLKDQRSVVGNKVT